MSAESQEEELEIIKGDDMLERMYEDKSQFLQSEWASNFFTNINYMKSVHNAQMKEKDEALQETAKLLYKQGTSIEDISNVTKLSIEAIQDIISKN